MIRINFPAYHPRIKKEKDREIIFDEFRKLWVTLTPEEWVRQNFLQYLTRVKHYPSSLIAVEKMILLGEMKKRFDIVVYDSRSLPWMLIECKEMNTVLDGNVLDQALRYNITLQVPYVVITNGSYCFAIAQKDGRVAELAELPSWEV